MLDAVQDLLQAVVATHCHTCDRPIDGPYVLEHVKVPGYTGRHEKAFCSKQHLAAWQDYVQRWETAHYEIPRSNTGPACGGC